MSKKIAFTYLTHVEVPSPTSDRNARFVRKPPKRPAGWQLINEFNRAWGFEDGNCGEWVGNEIVDPPGGFPEGFVEAQRKLRWGPIVSLKVYVYTDGSKKVELVDR